MTNNSDALSDARAREVLAKAYSDIGLHHAANRIRAGKYVGNWDGASIAAMVAYAKEATPPATDAPASGAGTLAAVDDGLGNDWFGDQDRAAAASKVASQKTRADFVKEFRDAARGHGRAGTTEWPGGPYMAMDDAAGVYADLMLAAPKVASEAAGLVTVPRDAFDHVVGMLHNAGFHSTAECFAALAHPSHIESATRADHAQGGGEVERCRALVSAVQDGQFDAIEAVADKWLESAGVQRMSNAIASVFEKHAPQDIMDRFREKVSGLMHLAFVEGAAQGVMQVAPLATTPGGDALEQAARDETVERGARALHEVEDSWNDCDWEYLPETVKGSFRDQAGHVIRALSPARDGAGS